MQYRKMAEDVLRRMAEGETEYAATKTTVEQELHALCDHYTVRAFNTHVREVERQVAVLQEDRRGE